MPDAEARRIRAQIEQFLDILQTVLGTLWSGKVSSARLAQLRKAVRHSAVLRETLAATQTRGGFAKWLPLLIRLSRELSTLAPKQVRTPLRKKISAKKKSARVSSRPPGPRAHANKRAAPARKKTLKAREGYNPYRAPPRSVAAFSDARSIDEVASVRPPRAGMAPSVEDELIHSKQRYANTRLLNDKGRRLDPARSLRFEQSIQVRLDIGALAADSQVSAGPAFPDNALSGDVDIDVMISSTDFVVWGADEKSGSSVAHGRLFLPGAGGPAIAADGTRNVTFKLTAPAAKGVARGRIGFYYRNALLQSQQLIAMVGQPGGFSIVTDFTVSSDLTGLDRIPDRPRLSILTNLNQEGAHQIVLRSVDPHTAAIDGRTFVVNEAAVGPTMTKIRNVLTERAPATQRRRRSELIADLTELAALGWSLYNQVATQNLDAFDVLRNSPGDYVMQILRPEGSGFVVPWALMYEIPLLSEKPSLCPLVDQWRDTEPLLSGSPRACPHGPHGDDVLCPFGFLGYRYAIEQLAKCDDVVVEIKAAADSSMVVAETQFQVNLADLAGHVANLRTLLLKALPRAQLREGKDKNSIRALLGQDLPLVYFFCHGQRNNIADPDTYLAVGQSETLTAQELIGWIVSWRRENKVVWNQVRPLIFINACHSLAVYPNTLMSYLDAFVGRARAAGVIGTEVRVNPQLASSFAERFFELLLTESRTVEYALRTIRFEHLAAGNLFGLVYTPYCWADLKITLN